MRVLHTSYTYWPRSDGVAIAMRQLSEGLAARGHDVTVACASDTDRGEEVHEGVHVVRFDVSGTQARGLHGQTEEYTDFVAAFECDVMMNYAAQSATTDLVFPLLNRLACRKVLIPCGYSSLGHPSFAEYFERLPEILRRYDRVVYLSGDYRDKRFGDENGVTNWEIIPNGASSDEFEVARTGFRERFGIRAPLLISCVANFMPEKGQAIVLEAFGRSGVTDAALVFLGSEMNRYAYGDLRAGGGRGSTWRRKAMIARYELVESRLSGSRDHLRYAAPGGCEVHICAGVPRELVVAALDESDLFAFGSRLECAPLVIYEAMASQTAFVSADVGCVAELPGGIVVDGVPEMAEAIHRLCTDADERAALARAGRAAWEREYRWETVVGRYEDLYRRLVGTDA